MTRTWPLKTGRVSRKARTSGSSRTTWAGMSPSRMRQNRQSGPGMRDLGAMANVNLSSGLPETELPDPPADAAAALESAGSDSGAVGEVVARWPRLLAGWATLGELAA